MALRFNRKILEIMRGYREDWGGKPEDPQITIMDEERN
jgi:hypothetical protein